MTIFFGISVLSYGLFRFQIMLSHQESSHFDYEEKDVLNEVILDYEKTGFNFGAFYVEVPELDP